jgi:glycosyltransferase involved in cell wall biosynthesis
MPARVAHVVNAVGLGGAELFLADLVARAREQGFDQVVLNPFARPSSAEFAERIRPVRHEAHVGGLRSAPVVRRWLHGRLADFRPDVVHVMLFPATVAMATLRRSPGVAWLQTNMYGPGLRVARLSRLKTPLDRWAGRRFDHVVAISRAVEQFLVTDYGYPPATVSCIPLGWDGAPRPRQADGRPPTVVCVAHFRTEKGHAVLLDAFALVRDEIPDARLVLVGQGELADALRAQVDRLGLGDSVEMTGPVADVWPVLARADVFALPSLSEAYGIAVAEAMAAGLPVVASAVGGVPELVEDGVTGELFPVGDHRALAAHLVRILGSPELAARMGAAARAAAEQMRRARSIDRYLDLCERLAHGKAASGSGR